MWEPRTGELRMGWHEGQCQLACHASGFIRVRRRSQRAPARALCCARSGGGLDVAAQLQRPTGQPNVFLAVPTQAMLKRLRRLYASCRCTPFRATVFRCLVEESATTDGGAAENPLGALDDDCVCSESPDMPFLIRPPPIKVRRIRIKPVCKGTCARLPQHHDTSKTSPSAHGVSRHYACNV